MLRRILILIKDILNENNLSGKEMYHVLEKCLTTINMLLNVADKSKDTKHIEEIAESIYEFMLLLELVNLYTRDDSIEGQI